MKFTPPEFLRSAHHWLILHGRYTCVARTPKCGTCVVFDDCEFAGRHKLRELQTQI
jgi:endonuclease-3